MPSRLPFAVLAWLALALPFVFGYTRPPIANFWPWLAAWGCAWVVLAVACSGCLHWGRLQWARCWAAALVLAALLAAGVGLVQYFAGDVGAAPWIVGTQPGLSIGNLRQRNQQASVLALGWWALLWCVAQGQPWLRQAPRWQGLALGMVLAWAMVVLAAATAATASRTGTLQWLLVLATLVLWRRTLGREVLALALLGTLAYALAAWLLPLLLQSWTGLPVDRLLARFVNDGQGCGGRAVLWRNMLELMALKPWMGWGWGELGYAHYATLFEGTRFCDLLDNAHNLPLHLAVTLGVPLALALLLAGALLVWRARPWREAQPARQLAWGVLALIGLHSLLEYPLWYGPFQVAALVAVALLWPGLRQPQGLVRAAWGGALALALAAGSYAAWDYQRVSPLYQPAPGGNAAPLWARAQASWLFADAVDFARLTTTPVTAANAAQSYALAQRLLHYSAEPRVIEPLLDSARLLGDAPALTWHSQRYQQAYPEAWARWHQRQPQ